VLSNTKLCLWCQTPITKVGTRKPFSYCASKCSKAAWASKNPELNLLAKQKYLQDSPIKRKESSKRYQQANKSFYAEYASLRSRKVQQAKPTWLDEFELLWVAEIYHAAQLRGLEVDHIVPIKHNRVCGLHVPWNMQLLTRTENARKSNKFDEDLICIIKG